MRWGLVVALLLVSPIIAGAATVEGRLELAGALTLPSGATTTSLPVALFVPDASEGGGATGSALTATVYVFNKSVVTTTILDRETAVTLGEERPNWQAHEIQIEVVPSRSGWMGLHATKGTLIEVAIDKLTFESEPNAAIGNGQANPDDANPEQPYYLVRADGPTIVRSSSNWTFEGSGLLKVMGPTVTIRSRENTTTVDTGEMDDPENPGRTIRRWVVVDFVDGEFGSNSMRAAAASRTVDATWNGTARLQSANGTLAGELGVWQANGGSQTVSGGFSATLIARQDPGRLDLILAGDLIDSTFIAEMRAPAKAASSLAWTLIAFAAAICGAGGAAALFRRHRRTHLVLAPDDYADLAGRAADGGDYERAAALTSRARDGSPTSARLAVDHAYFLAKSGHRDAAIHALHDPLIMSDPDGALFLATLHVEKGEDDEACAALCRALRLSPASLLDIETDPRLAHLLNHAAVKPAIREAQRQLE